MNGPEFSAKEIARRAWRDRTSPGFVRLAMRLTDRSMTIERKVSAIVASIATVQPCDADDAVLAVGTLCLALDIPCRIVMARVGQSWTCFLAYKNAFGYWRTVDAQTGREPSIVADEQVTIPMGPEDA